jgi:hypothetical protein
MAPDRDLRGELSIVPSEDPVSFFEREESVLATKG